jgi:alkanesulfonate monooxygenase SsuD/methylene tetrahydromethanopterin reductase-like flavin-dependent oxidoreductase (luciferase family)
MKFDIFLSICQTEVDGYKPSERVMFQNFFDQVKFADQLGFQTAWVAETHLSCQTQKQTPDAVVPHFLGEIGLNTDILQLAHLVHKCTSKIQVGSAIRNIICNGGPIAHAEAIKTFLTLHGMNDSESRVLQLGFAAGRFPFSNIPYGFYPKNDFEKSCWAVLKNKYFQQASEIFVRILSGEQISSADVSPLILTRADFRSDLDWQKTLKLSGHSGDSIRLASHWQFPKVGVIPFEAPMQLLNLTLGSHDPAVQKHVNQWMPVGVFNLSITPPEIIEQTHSFMQKHYHPAGGAWKREYMPRTLMVFIDKDSAKAKAQAEKAWRNYWIAMEGTLDPKKVADAVENTIAGNPIEVLEKIKSKYHQQDRLMAWFDFNIHDNDGIKNSMRLFIEKVAPELI